MRLTVRIPDYVAEVSAARGVPTGRLVRNALDLYLVPDLGLQFDLWLQDQVRDDGPIGQLARDLMARPFVLEQAFEAFRSDLRSDRWVPDAEESA